MTNRLNAAKNSQFPHTHSERERKNRHKRQTPNDTRRSVSLHITHFKHIFNICRTIINNNRSQCWIESTHFCVHTAYDWCTLSVQKIQTLNTEHVSFIRSIRIVRHPMDLSGNPDFSDLSRKCANADVLGSKFVVRFIRQMQSLGRCSYRTPYPFFADAPPILFCGDCELRGPPLDSHSGTKSSGNIGICNKFTL